MTAINIGGEDNEGMLFNKEKERNLEDFARRLNARLDEMKYPDKGYGRQTQLSKDLKTDQKTVRRWLEGLGFPRDHKLRELAKFLNLSPSTLKYGSYDGDLIANPIINDSDTLLTEKNKASGKSVPIFALEEIPKAYMDDSPRDMLRAPPFDNEASDGATLVQGTAMDDGTSEGFVHGSYVYWSRSSTAEVGDYVIARLDDGETTFRALDLDGNKRLLRALNSRYPIIGGDFEIVAIVTSKTSPVKSSIS